MSKGVRSEVMWFANQMEKVLKVNDWKGGWENMSMNYLVKKLLTSAANLAEARSHPRMLQEATDVANFAMMIADRVK